VSSRKPIRRALLSVYDKSELVELASALAAAGAQIVSTGATASTLKDAGFAVTDVAQLTGSPEMLGGRVKTLHPKVHAGLLADTNNPQHVADLIANETEVFDLLVVNLYPFSQTVRSGASNEEIIEQIDIGGPAMIRAAAKNFESVAVLVSPRQYPAAITEIASGGFTQQARRELATEAFGEIAGYDAAISNWFGGRHFTVHGTLVDKLRYGENPHQEASLYSDATNPVGLATAKLLSGKPMSYNNYVDAEAARAAAFDHVEPCAAIIKHANPCGIAIAENCLSAYRNAFDCDPVSAFGGVVALNRPLDVATAKAMVETFLEVVVAPAVDDDALEVCKEKSGLRVLKCTAPHPGQHSETRFLSGGFLRQRADDVSAKGGDPNEWSQVSGGEVSKAVLADLEFAWRCSRAPHSNAIVLAKGLATVGIGMGQVNRVDAVGLAVARAGAKRCVGAVAASDAFFPFPDGLARLIEAGVIAVVQPGGSIRDGEVIELAQKNDLPMFFTNVRHFSH